MHAFEVFAEVGVVLLMFSIGVEFSIPDLMRVKWIALGGGTLGILLSLAIALGASWLAGWTMVQGFVIGATISVASTMVLARLLADRDAMGTNYGRVMIGITLVEDIAVVFMTIVIPIFSGPAEGRLRTAAWTLGKATLLLVPLAFLAMTVVPRVLRRVSRTKDPELLLLVAIAICLVSASVAQACGFSVALGAFLAGLAISGADDLHHAHTTLIPLRDAFVALFFVSLGTLVVPQVIIDHLPLLGVMLALIIFGKFAIWFGVMKLFRYSLWTSIAVAAGLTQIGELSFILVQVARKAEPGRRRSLYRHVGRLADLHFPERPDRPRRFPLDPAEARRRTCRDRSFIDPCTGCLKISFAKKKQGNVSCPARVCLYSRKKSNFGGHRQIAQTAYSIS